MESELLTDASILDFGLFVAGCIAGYTWAQKTIVQLSNQRIDELKDDIERERQECGAEISSLKARVQELEDQRFNIARGAE